MLASLYREDASSPRVLWRTFLTALKITVAAVVLAALLSVGYSIFVKKSPLPQIFGYSFLTVATGSMSGTIEAGDMIIVGEQSSYRVGDVITFFPDGQDISTTHRIIRIEGDKFYTKGDANPSDDVRAVTADEIAGKVVAVIPRLGVAAEWIKTTEGMAFIAAAFALACAFVVVINLK